MEISSPHADLPRFSPGGSWLVYKVLPGGPGRKAGVSGFVTNIKGSTIFAMRADAPCPDGSHKCEGPPVEVTPQFRDSGASFPTFYVDGKKMFFTSVVYTEADGAKIPTQQIFAADMEAEPGGTRPAAQLTAPPPTNPYISNRILHVASDGVKAVWSRFNSHDSQPRRDLFKLKVTICQSRYDYGRNELGKCHPLLTVRPDFIMPLMRWYEAKGLSRNGTTMYYSGTPCLVTNPELFVMNLESGKKRRLTRTGPCVWDEQLAFSVGGDDEYLIFSSNRELKNPCKNFYDNLKSPNFPFLPPMETYAAPIDGGKPLRMTYGFPAGAERSNISINPADPTDGALMEIFPGPPRRIKYTRIRFPCR